MHLVLRQKNSYPYANASANFSGKANPFVTYFNFHLLGNASRYCPAFNKFKAYCITFMLKRYIAQLVKPVGAGKTPLLCFLLFCYAKNGSVIKQAKELHLLFAGCPHPHKHFAPAVFGAVLFHRRAADRKI